MKAILRHVACIGGALVFGLPGTYAAQGQRNIAPPKTRPAARQPAGVKKPAKSAAPVTPAQPVVPDVLTNETVIRLVHSGMSETDLVALVERSPAQFQMDAGHLTTLSEEKVPRAVIRAMLNKRSPAPITPTDSQAKPASAVAVETPPAPQPSPIPANLERPVIRYGAASSALADHAQKVVFVRSQSPDAKEAIANLLLSDVGLNLLTMGMASQMKMWNPYFGDTLAKAKALGKGLLRSRGADTQGFEYDLLPGTTSSVTVRQAKPELLIPMDRYLPGADVDLASVQPVLLRLEAREQDGSRLLAARRVLVKEMKKGRFDFKPTVERQELALEQNAVPVDVVLTDARVYRVVPKEDLQPGEYALVLRKKAESGAFTADLPLTPTHLSPDTEATMAQQAEAQETRGGLFGRSKPVAAPDAARGGEGQIAGFVAFDFRVDR